MSAGVITNCLDARTTNQEELMRYMTSDQPIAPDKVFA